MSYFRSTESIEQVLSDSIALSRAILTIKSISLHKFLLGFQRYEFHSKFRDNVTDNEILSIQINIQYITYLWKKKKKYYRRSTSIDFVPFLMVCLSLFRKIHTKAISLWM